MTSEEMAAFAALARLVLLVESRTNDDSHESFDLQASMDRATLDEYLKKRGEL